MDKVAGFFIGCAIFVVSIWVADWSRIYPLLAVVTVALWFLIVILAAKSRQRRDALTYLGVGVLFVLSITMPITWMWAGLTVVRWLKNPPQQ